MGTEALKSTSITNADASPVVANFAGIGAPGALRSVSDSLTVTTAKDSGSTYRLCRFDSNAIPKHLWIGVDTTVTAFTADIDVAYSDGLGDASSSNSGTIVQISSADNKIFGAAVDLKTAGLVDYIKNISSAKRNQPMWQLLGLTVDPGGKFDILLKATATTNGAAIVYAELVYTV